MSVSIFIPHDSGVQNFDQLGEALADIAPQKNGSERLKMLGAATSNDVRKGVVFEIYNWTLGKGTHGRVCINNGDQIGRKTLVEALLKLGGQIEKGRVNGADGESQTVTENPTSQFSVLLRDFRGSPRDFVSSLTQRLGEKSAAKVQQTLRPECAEVMTKGKNTTITFLQSNLDELKAEVETVITTFLDGRIVSSQGNKAKQGKDASRSTTS